MVNLNACQMESCLDEAAALLRQAPRASWRDEHSGLATDDLVIDRDAARHIADEIEALREEVGILRAFAAERGAAASCDTGAIHARNEMVWAGLCVVGEDTPRAMLIEDLRAAATDVDALLREVDRLRALEATAKERCIEVAKAAVAHLTKGYCDE